MKTNIFMPVFVPIVLLTLITIKSYPGSAAIYLFFTVIANCLLYISLSRHSIFFDTFIGIFLWLGFWLKFSIRQVFFNGQFYVPVGSFDGSPHSLDSALVASTIGLSGVLVGSLIRMKFFSYKNDRHNYVYERIADKYETYRLVTYVLLILAVLFVCLANLYLGVYQRGIVSRTSLPFGLNGVVTWLLLFGFTSFVALLVQFELARNRLPYIAYCLGLFETFIVSISLLSRGMIINASSLFIGIFRHQYLCKDLLSKKTAKFFIFVFIFTPVLFLSSVYIVNHLRTTGLADTIADEGLSGVATVYQSYDEQSNRYYTYILTRLLLDRWVGIEGIMSVDSYPDKDLKLFKKALSEKFSYEENSFYDSTFIASPYNNLHAEKTHSISLPGLLAFLFYSGSYLLLFLGVFVFCLFAALIEYLAYIFSFNNLVFSSLIAQVVAYRYIHFGYVPSQSYLLLFSIAGTILIVYSLLKLLLLNSDTKVNAGN